MRKGLFMLITLLIAAGSLTISSAAIIIPATTTEPSPVAIKAATDAFKSLSKKERKEKIKEVKKEIKNYNAAKKAGKEPSTNTVLLVILAILLPPLAVYLHQGEINNKFWISLILTILGFLPGIIYALIVILGNK